MSYLFSRLAVFTWATCIPLLASAAVAQSSPHNVVHSNSAGSLRGLASTNHNPYLATDDDQEDENEDKNKNYWWSDPFALFGIGDPSEEDEIQYNTTSESSPQTPMLHTTVNGAPFLGPVINITKLEQLQQQQDRPQRTSRIVNGQAAKPQSFFTMLLVKENNDWKWSGCGGTLISNCHVLTAGHCLSNPTLKVEGVFVNAHNPFQDNNNHPFHFSLVKQRDVHPNFVQRTNKADIGIIHLQECVNVQDFPPAIVAQDQAAFRSDNKQLMKIFGFGSMSDAANVPADQLRQAVLPFISRDACQNYYPNGEVLIDMVCAGYAHTGGADACQGDSGGGMFLNGGVESAAPVVVGITSWGVGCGRKNFPGVYIYIPYYRNWILQRICPSSNSAKPWCPSLAPPQTQQQQQQQPSNNNNNNNNNQGTCKEEGAYCSLGGDSECCSNFCRGFPGSTSRICSGSLPAHQEQGKTPQASQSDPNKRGGAGGAKQREP